MDLIALWYNNIKRSFRNLYNWPPYVVDKIEIDELIRIKEEAEEDNKKEGQETYENEIE